MTSFTRTSDHINKKIYCMLASNQSKITKIKNVPFNLPSDWLKQIALRIQPISRLNLLRITNNMFFLHNRLLHLVQFWYRDFVLNIMWTVGNGRWIFFYWGKIFAITISVTFTGFEADLATSAVFLFYCPVGSDFLR